MRKIHTILVSFLFFLHYLGLLRFSAQNLICNGDFEDTLFVFSFNTLNDSLVPCWESASSTMEIWKNTTNPEPYSGEQFVEINANDEDTIYQDFNVVPGSSITIGFAHRGRLGTDVLGLQIGPVNGPYVDLGQYADSNDVWGYHTVNYTIPTSFPSTVRLRMYSYAVADSNLSSFGNFVDSVSVTLNSTTGIYEVEKRNFSLFPNPSNGKFTIQSEQSGIFDVIDINGKIIQTYVLKQGFNSIDGYLLPGLYFIREKHSRFVDRLVVCE